MRRSCLGFGLTLLLSLVAATPAVAQAPPAAAAPKAKEIPKPEDIVLETRDGLQLEATYYGSIEGKEAVPIIMLHGWKGSRGDFEGLALQMQAHGHAVIVPDLRGHGKSTLVKVNGDTLTIDQATMKRGDFEAMVTQDLERVNQFLIEKNNAGELNLDKLCLVGYEMGAVVAVQYAIRDWSWPALPAGKQGQDVRALVLISPPMNFRGISISGALDRVPLTGGDNGASVLLMYGSKNSTEAADVKRMFNKLNTYRPKLTTDAEKLDRLDLFQVPLNGVTLQSAAVFKDAAILKPLDATIAQFIELRLVKKKFPWAYRKSALGQ